MRWAEKLSGLYLRSFCENIIRCSRLLLARQRARPWKRLWLKWRNTIYVIKQGLWLITRIRNVKSAHLKCVSLYPCNSYRDLLQWRQNTSICVQRVQYLPHLEHKLITRTLIKLTCIWILLSYPTENMFELDHVTEPLERTTWWKRSTVFLFWTSNRFTSRIQSDWKIIFNFVKSRLVNDSVTLR